MSHLRKCYKKDLLQNCDHFVVDQLQYEVIMGSMAYGVSSDNSDIDIYGFTIPPKDMIIRANYIPLYDDNPKYFEQFQKHHIKKEPIEYDFTIYNIAKFFRLCQNCNPNMIDALFVPERCITFMTPIGRLIRDNRHLFLCKKVYHTFAGYAYQQLHKMNIKKANPESKRYESVLHYDYDVKFAYHIVRLMDEVEQILNEHNLDLERNREKLKSIRRGEWKKEEIIEYFKDNESRLKKIYDESTLPYNIRKEEIKELLIKCLKMHFGDDLFKDIKLTLTSSIINDIKRILEKYEY